MIKYIVYVELSEYCWICYQGTDRYLAGMCITALMASKSAGWVEVPL